MNFSCNRSNTIFFPDTRNNILNLNCIHEAESPYSITPPAVKPNVGHNMFHMHYKSRSTNLFSLFYPILYTLSLQMNFKVLQ